MVPVDQLTKQCVCANGLCLSTQRSMAQRMPAAQKRTHMIRFLANSILDHFTNLQVKWG